MPSYIHLARTVSPFNPPLCAAALPALSTPHTHPTPIFVYNGTHNLDFDIFSLPSSTKPANMSDVIVDEAVYQKIVQTDNVSGTQT